MRCENCGTELPDGARFCYMCASPVGEKTGAEAAEGVEPAAVVEDGEGSDAGEGQVDGDDDETVAEPVADGAADVAAAAPAEVPVVASEEDDALEDDVDAQPFSAAEAPVIPAPVKLEGPLPVAAVPFVPMAPAPRSTYVQRRVTRPVRSTRPGANSAPTIASGYESGAWPQNSAWSLDPNGAGNAASAPAQGNAENPVDGMKNKLTRAFDSWGASSAARSEKKRQEREIREAARKVQEAERAAAREAEDRARREAAAKVAREEKERMEREALIAFRRRAVDEPTEEEIAAEPQVDEVAEQVAPAEVEPVSADVAAAPDAADLTVPTPAVVVDEPTPVDEPAVVAEPAPVSTEGPVAPEFAEATQVMEPVSARKPTISVPEVPDMPTTDDNYIETGDITGFWGDEDEDLDSESTGHLDSARRPYADDGPSMNAYTFKARNRHQSKKLHLAVGIAILAVLLIGIGAFAALSGSPAKTETPQLKPSTDVTAITTDTTEGEATEEETGDVAVKATVEDYTWSDLSKISALISACTSESEALKVAEKYNLCSATGTLDGTQTKSLRLTDGTTVNMRIVGFWHDLKSDGTGHAGISMLADSSVATMPMSESSSDADWGSSSLRTWLNGEFVELLPSEVKEALVSVSKQTNRYTSTSEQEATDDSVWLISYSELVGSLESGSYRYDSYSSEGEQYQLFANLGVTWSEANSAMSVGGDCVNWWTRSTDTVNAERIIAPRNEDGYPGYSRNPTVSGEVGVVPGFCL